jgi:hypothetical protein
MKLPKLFLVSAISVLLTACGGSGGDPHPATPPTTPTGNGANPGTASPVGSAEGLYAGQIAAQFSWLLILENGDTWLLPGSEDGNRVFTPNLLFHGPAQVANGQLTATFDSRTLTATVDGTNLNGSILSSPLPDSDVPVMMSKNEVVGYRYDMQAQLADIAGSNWQTTSSSTTSTLPISATGIATLGANFIAPDCNSDITLQPRASGKNVFNASVDSATCPIVNGAGIALHYVDAASRQQLLIVLPTSDGGAIVTAAR